MKEETYHDVPSFLSDGLEPACIDRFGTLPTVTWDRRGHGVVEVISRYLPMCGTHRAGAGVLWGGLADKRVLEDL